MSFISNQPSNAPSGGVARATLVPQPSPTPPNLSASLASASQIAGLTQNMVGGRAILASAKPCVPGGGLGNSMAFTSRKSYVMGANAADLRLLFDDCFSQDKATVMLNPVVVTASIEIVVNMTTLFSALNTGAAITSLPTASQPDNALPATTQLTLTDPTGVHSQTWQLTAASTPNGASYAVSSQVPNYAYPANSVITATVEIPVLFGGSTSGTLSPGSALLSDPCPIEVTKGQTIFVRSRQGSSFSSYNGYLSTTGAVAAGITQLVVPSFPDGQLPRTVTFGQGGSAETVTVLSYSGTGPYTLQFAAPTVNAHGNGTPIGDGGFSNVYLYGDQGDGQISAPAPNPHIGDNAPIPAYSTLSTTTLAAPIVAGANSFQTNGNVSGKTIQVDTGGAVETVTIQNWTGTVAPFTAYIQGTFASNHASGAVVSSTVPVGTGFGPSAIVADRITGQRTKSVLLYGDSIPNGTGYGERTGSSYVKDALDLLQVPYVDITQAGETLAQFQSIWGSQKRRRRLGLCDWAYDEYGTNDIWGGLTLAQLQANKLASWTALKARGVKVCAQTIIPRTTSLDNWATTNFQTRSPTADPIRTAYNDWIRNFANNGLIGAYIDAVFDMASVLEVNGAGVLTINGGYWMPSTGTLQGLTGQFTADGVHPSWIGHLVMGLALTPAVPAIFV